jgi:hypothetical protein
MRHLMTGLLCAGGLAAGEPVFQWPGGADQGKPELVWRQGGTVRFEDGPTRVETTAQSGVIGKETIPLPTGFTIEAVFRADRRRGNLQIINSAVFQFAKNAPAFAGDRRLWCLEVRGEGRNLAPVGFLSLAVKGSEGQWHKVFSQGRIFTGWHHVVGVCDGKTVQLYLDGVPQSRTMHAGAERLPNGLLSPPGVDGLSVVVSDGAGRYAHGGYRSANNGLDGALAFLRVDGNALDREDALARHQQALGRFPMLASQAKPRVARPRAPFHVLYSNDFTNTGIVAPWHSAGEPFKPEHLRGSVLEAAGANVHMLQPAHGQVPWWPSKVYPLAEHHQWWAERYGIPVDKQGIPGVHRFIMGGGDPFEVFLKAAQESKQLPFISMRLNDIHHAYHADETHARTGYHAFGKFYAEHPEYRLGPAGTGLDWAIPEVREHMLAFIREICQNYDLAGFELDFMRFPNFFRPEFPQADRERIIADFVRQVSGLLGNRSPDGIGKRWLCARVPAQLAKHAEVGIYLPDLADAGLDMVNLSASYFTDFRHDVVAIRSMLPDTTIYVEMCHAALTGKALTKTGGDNFSFLRTTDQQYYTAAHLAYEQGADGVSLFNFVYTREHGQNVKERGPWNEPPFHILKHLGDPAWLARQPQWYVLANTWGEPAFPPSLDPGVAITCDLAMAPTGHQREDGILRVMTRQDGADAAWFVAVNGTDLSPIPFVAKPLPHPYDANLNIQGHYACFALPRQLVKRGTNHIVLMRRDGAPVAVQYVDLTLP